MAQSSKQNKSPETNTKAAEIYKFSYKEFQVIFLTPTNLWENTDRQLCKIRKTVHE